MKIDIDKLRYLTDQDIIVWKSYKTVPYSIGGWCETTVGGFEVRIQWVEDTTSKSREYNTITIFKKPRWYEKLIDFIVDDYETLEAFTRRTTHSVEYANNTSLDNLTDLISDKIYEAQLKEESSNHICSDFNDKLNRILK